LKVIGEPEVLDEVGSIIYSCKGALEKVIDEVERETTLQREKNPKHIK